MRPAKLVKYLSRANWSPLVLTAKAEATLTPNLATEVAGVPTLRIPRLDWLGGLVRLRDWFRSWPSAPARSGAAVAPTAARRHGLANYMCVPDRFLLWSFLATLAGFCAFASRPPDVLYASSPSPCSALVAVALKHLLRRPFVLEFRDLWVGNPFRKVRPLAWVERLERALERMVVRQAAAFVVVSGPMKETLLQQYAWIPAEKVHVVPNGFDLEDFQGIEAMTFERTTILHAGNFYEDRSAGPFLEALAAHRKRVGDHAMTALQVLFAGRPDPQVEAQIAALDLAPWVRQIGMVDHARMLRMMLGAHILLLIPGPGKGTMTGKVFEYMAAGKPILAVAGPGCVADLVTEHRLGEVADPMDMNALEAALDKLLGNLQGLPVGRGRNSWMDTYSREAIARQVAGILVAVSSEGRAWRA